MPHGESPSKPSASPPPRKATPRSRKEGAKSKPAPKKLPYQDQLKLLRPVPSDIDIAQSVTPKPSPRSRKRSAIRPSELELMAGTRPRSS